MIQIQQKEASFTDTVSDAIIVLAEGELLHLPPGTTSFRKKIKATLARMNYRVRGATYTNQLPSTPVIISGCGSDASFYARNIEQATAALFDLAFGRAIKISLWRL